MTNEERRIARLRKELAALEPMLPGSISTQWNVCGTPGCRCKDKAHPVKHGPYFQLSFTVAGKSSTLFLKKNDLIEARRRIRNYKRFKQLCVELIEASIVLTRRQGFTRSQR